MDPESGALLANAIWAVDGLYYLLDVDNEAFVSQNRLYGAHPDTVELTHVRWAVSSAATALDLCAAALARRSGIPVQGRREADIETLNVAGKTTKKAHMIKSQLSQPALTWVTQVTQDADYATLLEVRHALTHRRLPRHLSVSIGGAGSTSRRLSLPVGASLAGIPRPVGSRELVKLSVDVAMHHMEFLFAEIAAGRH